MAAVTNLNTRRRRTYAGEEAWFELLAELGHRRLRNALIDSGLTAQVAGGIVWFLDDQVNLDRRQTNVTRVRYRRVLAELDPEEVRARAIPGLFNLAWSA